MSKKEKREEKIRNNRTNVSIEEFESLIVQYGTIKEGGKHPQAIVGKRVLPYKRENPIKKIYVDKLLTMIDSL